MECFDLECVMCTAVTATGRRNFSLGDSHCGTCSCNIKLCEHALCDEPRTHKPAGHVMRIDPSGGEGAAYSDFSPCCKHPLTLANT